MRKFHLISMIAVAIFLLAACSEGSESTRPQAAETFIEVTNSSARQITSIELKLYQNEMVQASPTAMNADESLIVMGEAVDFDILSNDINFDEPVVIEAVAMINGVEVSAGETEPMQIVQGESYRFELAQEPELQFREVLEE